MNILICCNNKYLYYARRLLFSLRKHNDDLNIYVMFDKIDEKDLNDFYNEAIKSDLGNIHFIKFCSDNIKLPLRNNNLTGHITREAYFRLFAPFLLPESVDKILYLDCDIICRDNISHFYNMSFNDKVLCAIENVDVDNGKYNVNLGLAEDNTYFNSGVLLINVSAYKDFMNYDKLVNFIYNNADILQFQDQDVLNSLFHNQINEADVNYNYQINSLLYNDGGVLIHYSGSVKPWDDNYNSPILARHYYDVLNDMGLNNELMHLKNEHFNNFKSGSKWGNVIVKMESLDYMEILNMLKQTEDNMQFIIEYNGVIGEDYEHLMKKDCRLDIFSSDVLSKNISGHLVSKMDINDFSNMDINFLREVFCYCYSNKLAYLFFNCFSISNITSHVEDLHDDSLILYSNYFCIKNIFDKENNKIGFWLSN